MRRDDGLSLWSNRIPGVGGVKMGVASTGVLRYKSGRVGTWLSLVEHRVRDAGVGGSNPLVPTIS
jgi:hypothetical protein